MLSIDGTLVVQIANFLFLLVVLNVILYKPIRGILAKRDKEMTSRQDMIDDYRGRVEEREREIETGMVSARKEGFQEKEALKGQGQDEEKGILAEAGSAVEQKLKTAKGEIEEKMVDARKTLEGEIVGFSNELAEKILGRSVQ